MIEMTFADIFLLTWALLATVYGLVAREEILKNKNFVHILIQNKTQRDKFFAEMDKHIEEKANG